MWKSFIRYLHFTRAERHGLIALSLLGAAFYLYPTIYEQFLPSQKTNFEQLQAELAGRQIQLENTQTREPSVLFEFDPNTVSKEDLVRLGLTEKLAGTICRYREKGGRYRKPEDFKKMYGLADTDYVRLKPYLIFEQKSEKQEYASAQPKFETFPFDPNTASQQDFERLGLRTYLAERIIRYREKGGRFRQKEDLKKIYSFPPALYDRLESWISIAEAPKPVTASFATYTKPVYAPKPKQPVTIDINKSESADWQRLPGIGAARADWIVRFRDRLGGFVSIDQVAETRGLPDSIFRQIRPSLQLSEAVFRPIRLNQANLDELKNHPYIGPNRASAILAYRNQHGPFSSTDQLARLTLCNDPAWLNKIRPYIVVN